MSDTEHGPAVEIRRATTADAGALASFAARTFLEAYGPDNQPAHVRAYVADAFDPDLVRRQLDDPARITLLAERADRLVGYVALRLWSPIEAVDDDAPMELTRIYVDAREQGAGVGAALLEAAFAVARETGHRSIWLAVWERNQGARRFYERHGFRKVGRTHFLLGPERQEDDVLLRQLDQ